MYCVCICILQGKGKGKGKKIVKERNGEPTMPSFQPLRTLDVFSGCGGNMLH